MIHGLKLAAIAAIITGFSSASWGQSGQYQRPKKADAPAAAPSAVPVASGKDAKKDASPGVKKDEKVDIQEIENQYWSAKDTDFKVVQNRRYSKEKRFFGSVMYGSLIGHDERSGGAMYLGVGYFFNEQHGVEVNYTSYSTEFSAGQKEVINKGGFMNHNKMESFYGLSYHWSPIYAKLSLLDWKILYFDMTFSPVVGMTNVKQLIGTSATSPQEESAGPYFTFGIDVAQHFYMSDHFALKVDFKNRFYSEKIKTFYATGGSRTESSKSQNITTLGIGLEYFY